jgi:hypothetical protein
MSLRANRSNLCLERDYFVAYVPRKEDDVMVKYIICAKRKAGMTWEEFDAYWRHHHGTGVKSVPECIRHATRRSAGEMRRPQSRDTIGYA